MNIFEALRADHDHQRTLIAGLVKTSGDEPERTRIFNELKHAMELHAAAEERHFYAPLIKADLTQEMARHSIAEHKELDDLLEALTKTEHSSPSWLATAKQLEHRLLHHLEEEEREIFQLGGRALTDAEKSELADAYKKHMHANA